MTKSLVKRAYITETLPCIADPAKIRVVAPADGEVGASYPTFIGSYLTRSTRGRLTCFPTRGVKPDHHLRIGQGYHDAG